MQKRESLERCIAVGSGKGGVGKSTTAINLSLMYARQQKNTAIVDLDPLSNITTILDIDEHNNYDIPAIDAHSLAFEDIVLHYSDTCDILFPTKKAVDGNAQILSHLIFRKFAHCMQKMYDYIILDLPAGLANEYLSEFMPYIKLLLVVLQPEPTSHLTSGAYVKAALEINKSLEVFFWHNKYSPIKTRHFLDDKIITNYNNYVEKEYRINEKQKKQCKNIAFIPPESTLDMLNSVQRPEEYAWHNMNSTLKYLNEICVLTFLRIPKVSPQLQEFIYYFFHTLSHIANPDEIRTHLINECESATRLTLLPKSAQQQIRKIDNNAFAPLLSCPLYQYIRIALQKFETLDNNNSVGIDTVRVYEIFRQSVIQVLQEIDKQIYSLSPRFRRMEALLALHLVLCAIGKNKKTSDLIYQHIPMRIKDGVRIRNRRSQIQHLVFKNDQLHKRHLLLLKQIYPIVMHILDRYKSSLNLKYIILASRTGGDDRLFYIRMISQSLHEIMHSGLGVAIGIKTSNAYWNTKKASEYLEAALKGHE